MYERERMCVCVRERERECVCMREREWVCMRETLPHVRKCGKGSALLKGHI